MGLLPYVCLIPGSVTKWGHVLIIYDSLPFYTQQGLSCRKWGSGGKRERQSGFLSGTAGDHRNRTGTWVDTEAQDSK